MSEEIGINIVAHYQQAKETLAQLGKDIDKLAGGVETSAGRVKAGAGNMASGVREATQTVRAMSTGLLSELNPALASSVQQFSMATRSAMQMAPALGGVVIGVAAVSIGLGMLVHRLDESAKRQVDLNRAVKAFDAQGLGSSLATASANLEKFNDSTWSTIDRLATKVASMPGIWGAGLVKWFAGGDEIRKAEKKTREAFQDVFPAQMAERFAGIRAKELDVTMALLAGEKELATVRGSAASVLAIERQITGAMEAQGRELMKQLKATQLQETGRLSESLKFAPEGERITMLAELAAAQLEDQKRLQKTVDVQKERLSVERQLRNIELERAAKAVDTANLMALFAGEEKAFDFSPAAEQAGKDALLRIRAAQIESAALQVPGYADESAARAEGGATLEEKKRTGEWLKQFDEESIQHRVTLLGLERERVELGLQIEGLSQRDKDLLEATVASERTRLDLLQAQLRIEAAGDDPRKQRIAEAENALDATRRQIEDENRRRRILERDDPMAGLAAGFHDIEDEFGHVGKNMRDLAQTTARGMQSAFSDSFFNVVTGQFDKLKDVGKNFGQSILRGLTDALSKQAVAAILRPLQQALGGGGQGGSFFSLAAPGGMGVPGVASFLPTAGTGVAGVGGIGGGTGGGGGFLGGGAGGGVSPLGFLIGPEGTSPISPGTTPGGGIMDLVGGLPWGQAMNLLPGGGLAGMGGISSLMNTSLISPSMANALQAEAIWAAGGTSAQVSAAASSGGLAGGGGMTVAGALGGAAAIAGLGLTIYGALTTPQTTSSIVMNAASGAVSGAVLGTMIAPGIGTAIGAIAGALVAGGASAFGKSKDDTDSNKRKAERVQTANAVFSEMTQAIGTIRTKEDAGRVAHQRLSSGNTVGGLIFSLVHHQANGLFQIWQPPNPAYFKIQGLLNQLGNFGSPNVEQFNQGRVNSMYELLAANGVDNTRQFLDMVLDLVNQLEAAERKAAEAKEGTIDAALAPLPVAIEEEFLGVEGAGLAEAGLRRTILPGSRVGEFTGRDIFTVPEEVLYANLDPNLAELVLRRLQEVDRDRNLGILTREAGF